ncbi:MAG TPA: LysM peptidoglycan-binding domain-containing protein, partial [Ancylobacter sp.]
MRNLLSASGSPALLRLSVVALLGGSAAACSSDVSRFQDPNGSPFAANQASPAYTGSVAAAPTSAVQGGPIPGAPMAPVASNNYPGAYGAPTAAAPYGAPQRVAMATPAQQPLYGTQPRPVATPAPVAAATAHAPQVASAGSHVVTSGQTLSSISRQYGIPLSTLAAANGMDTNSQVRIGQKVTLPGAAGAATAVAAAAPKVVAPVMPPATKPVTTVQAAAVAAATKPVATAAAPVIEPKAQTIAAVKPSETPEEARVADGVQFRWPVRGRVISGFGPKPGGQQNEGINV